MSSSNPNGRSFLRGAEFVEERAVEPHKAANFLDCDYGDEFWQKFRSAYSSTGPLSALTGSLAYMKWKEWETFIDGMDATDAWNNVNIFVPLTGEWRPDGSAFYTEIREKRDWIRAMQKSQWQGLFGSKPHWSFDNLVGFMLCPVGFALVQYIVFLVHKIRSNLPEDAARVNLDSTRFAFVTILDFTFDHLESSNWNTSSFDLAVNLNLDPTFYRTYSEYIRQMAPLPLHFPSREEWQGRPSQGLQMSLESLGSMPLKVALVGEHGPSNLDHLAAVQQAVQQAVAHPIEAGHFFSYLWQLEGRRSVPKMFEVRF